MDYNGAAFMDNDLINNLPDLPELESVELRNWQMLLMLSGQIMLALLFAGTSAWIYLRYREYIGLRGSILIFLMLGLAAWAILRVLFAGLYWKTDRQGLTMRGILCRRFVEWMEIEEAHSKRSLSRELVYILRTRKGTITVPTRMDGNKYSGQELAASIWQHLRRIGKADRLELPSEALTFWDSIPDDLPREIDWQSPGRKPNMTRLAIGSAIMPAIFLVGIIYLACANSRSYFPAVMLALLIVPNAVMFHGLYRCAVRTAFSFSLREHSFEANAPNGRWQALWSEVTSAQWERGGLAIIVNHWRVYVPYTPGDDDKGKLVLGVIRKLRSEAQRAAVIIPDALRASDQGTEAPILHAGQAADAELKPRLAEKILGVAAAPMILGLVPLYLDQRFHSALLTAASLGITALLGLLAANTYHYRITDDGVEKRLFWYHRRVRWDQVTKYDFSITQQHGHRKWILRSADGKKLIDVTLDIGSKAKKQQFEGSLNAHLAQIMPAVFNRPWLARPFSK